MVLQRQPATVAIGNHRSMMREISIEFFLNDVASFFYTNTYCFYRHRSLFAIVFVGQFVGTTINFFSIQIRHIGTAAGMHPSAEFIKALVNKKLSPGNGAVGIQSFFAYYMHFGPEVKCDMWVDVQNRIAGLGKIGRKGKTIGANIIIVAKYNWWGICRFFCSVKIFKFSH